MKNGKNIGASRNKPHGTKKTHLPAKRMGDAAIFQTLDELLPIPALLVDQKGAILDRSGDLSMLWMDSREKSAHKDSGSDTASSKTPLRKRKSSPDHVSDLAMGQELLSLLKKKRNSFQLQTRQKSGLGVQIKAGALRNGARMLFFCFAEEKKNNSPDQPAYLNNLIGSISPIVTISHNMSVQYANDSFLREFKLKSSSIRGKSLFDLIHMRRNDQELFVNNLHDSEGRNIENAEFTVKSRIFGYSIFRFGDETGIILKEITSLKRLQKQVESLHARMLRLQEMERRKISAELHDSVGQTILAAKINFNTYMKDPENLQERYKTGLELIDRASQELREIYQNLYPSILSDLGLEAAIRWYAKNFLEVKGIETSLEIHLPERFAEEQETGLFRMVQEIFNNIVKHSKANHALLTIRHHNKSIYLHAEDDGVGFQMEAARLKGGLGLANLRSRVEDHHGKIRIESVPGEKTTIDIEMIVRN